MSEACKVTASKAFEYPLSITPTDIDLLGHVNNVVYVRWIQDIAVAHWRAAAPLQDQDAFLWIVLRHEIDYKQPALPGDELYGRTWVGSASRLKFERHTEIRRVTDDGLLVKARTLWCPVSRHTGRPTAVRPEVRALFTNEGAGTASPA